MGEGLGDKRLILILRPFREPGEGKGEGRGRKRGDPFKLYKAGGADEWFSGDVEK